MINKTIKDTITPPVDNERGDQSFISEIENLLND